MHLAAPRAPWLLLSLSFLLIGCGPSNRAEVTGLVSLDGKPVDAGSINFFPTGDNKGPSAGGTIVNGKFKVADAVVGKNRVEIQSAGKSGKKMPSAMDKSVMIDEIAELIPAKYNKNSELTVDIKPSVNETKFDLLTK